jgi:hypothetical protein
MRTESGANVLGDELDTVWKALSDSTRRSILDLLRQGPERRPRSSTLVHT